MAHIHFDNSYAPCGFLIVCKDGDAYNEADTVLVQTDWEYPSVASRMGWFIKCDCPTDGTVDCEHHTAGEFISSAYDHIRDHEGETFPELSDYFC